jgi:hypothetical protein
MRRASSGYRAPTSPAIDLHRFRVKQMRREVERALGLYPWRCALALIAFAATVAILLLYVLHFHKAEFTSDDAVVNLLAGEMFQQGRLLPHAWVTNNGDLLVPSGAPLVAILLHWFPNGFGVHSVAGVFAVATLLTTFIWLLRLLRMPWIVVLLLSAFVGSGISKQFAYFVFAQTTYLWWPLGFLLGAALICRARLALNATPARVRSSSFLLLLVVFSISFANPGRVFIMVVVPLCAFVLALTPAPLASGPQKTLWRCLRDRLGSRDPLMFGIGAGFVSALAAYLLLKSIGTTENVNGAAALSLNDWSGAWRNLGSFGKGWLPYLGAEKASAHAGSFLASCLYAFGSAIAVVLTLVGIREFWLLRNHNDPVRSAVTISFLFAFVPIFVMYVTFDTLAADKATLRYFTVPVVILGVLAAFPLRDLTEAFPRASYNALPAIGIALILVAAWRFLPPESFGEPAQEESRSARATRLAQALRSEGLKWGYASWWNAGVTTVMAEDAVRVNPITFLPSGILPAAAMVSHDWYRPERWSGQTFLVLTHSEASEGRMDALMGKLGPAISRFYVAGYDVLVYGHNISMDFECSFSAPVDRPIADGTPTLRLASARVVAANAPSPPLAIVRVRNEGEAELGGGGRYPISIGIQLLDAADAVVDPDWLHVPLPCTLEPGEEKEIKVELPRMPTGKWRARFDLVQEGVVWFQNRGMRPIDVALPSIIPVPERPLLETDLQSHP